MPDLQYWQEKIKERRQSTPWRDFIGEIASRYPVTFYKYRTQISRFPNTKRISNIIEYKVFDENRDDLYQIDYNTKQTFSDQFSKLITSVNLPGMIHYAGCENSDYADNIFGVKNVYLSCVVSNNCENVLYSLNIKENSNNVLNSIMVFDNCQNIYYSKGIIESYNVFYSKYIINSSNIFLSDNLIGCSECVGCSDLENKKYCIDNKQYSQTEYIKLKEEIIKDKTNFANSYSKIGKRGNNYGSNNCTGDFVINSSNTTNGILSYNVHNGRNLVLVGGIEGDTNNYDIFSGGTISGDNCYGVLSYGINCSHLYNCNLVANSSNIYYSRFIESCSYCFGCIGLKNKSYCILNKQYSKDDRHQKVDEIFSQMEADGTLGDFFPGRMNPFYFNDTAAYLIDDSFTKEEVEAEGYLRRDEPIKVDIPEGVQTVHVDKLDQYEYWKESPLTKGEDEPKTNWRIKKTWYIDPEILKKVIVDNDGNAYRIISMEYDFLMRHGLPLPRKHQLDRLKQHFKFR